MCDCVLSFWVMKQEIGFTVLKFKYVGLDKPMLMTFVNTVSFKEIIFSKSESLALVVYKNQ